MYKFLLVMAVACQQAQEAAVFSKQPSKSGSVALSEDEKWVVMVNTDDGSISVLDAASNTRTAQVKTGREPWAVVIAADNKTAYVANRADATVVKVSGIDTTSPVVSGTVSTGSEPMALALSPSAKTLYVAEWAEGRLVAVDTATMAETAATDTPVNPRALAVTNNGDQNDNDEMIIMPEFFGEPIGTEATNESRQGVVRFFNASNLEPNGAPLVFAPLQTSFKDGALAMAAPTDDVRGTGNPVKASPNQLSAVAIASGKLFVTAIAAAPAGKAQFNNNVYSSILVGDIATHAVDAASTFVLLDKIVAQDGLSPIVPTAAKRLAMGDITDMAFVRDRNIAYVVSKAADGVQRVVFGDTPALGSSQNFQIDVSSDCKNPVGIVAKSDGTRAWLNCYVSRKLGVIDLTSQALATAVESSPSPAAGTNDDRVLRGKRFYFTGRGRWSKGGEGWSSCGSCHPDGLSDNITWSFGTGPRQSISQDGSFSYGARAGKQRVFNATAIFDEHHDFERNTRNVSGGLGAITRPKAGKSAADCGVAANEEGIPLTVDGAPAGTGITGLGKPLKSLNEAPLDGNGCKLKDWDEIDEFVKTIRPPGKLRKLDGAAVDAGRAIFSTTGGCAKCHGGAGWTLSRRFFEPSDSRNTSLASTEMFVRPGVWPSAPAFNENVGPLIGDSPAPVAKPPQVACVIRKVDTFGDDALEKKDDGTAAQGKNGYNIPSLYGLAVGAPYLHHGGAKTLEQLFSSSAYSKHTEAGAANFLPNETERKQLIAFLLSIDADAPEIDAPAGFDGCPAN